MVKVARRVMQLRCTRAGSSRNSTARGRNSLGSRYKTQNKQRLRSVGIGNSAKCEGGRVPSFAPVLGTSSDSNGRLELFFFVYRTVSFLLS